MDKKTSSLETKTKQQSTNHLTIEQIYKLFSTLDNNVLLQLYRSKFTLEDIRKAMIKLYEENSHDIDFLKRFFTLDVMSENSIKSVLFSGYIDTSQEYNILKDYIRYCNVNNFKGILNYLSTADVASYIQLVEISNKRLLDYFSQGNRLDEQSEKLVKNYIINIVNKIGNVRYVEIIMTSLQICTFIDLDIYQEYLDKSYNLLRRSSTRVESYGMTKLDIVAPSLLDLSSRYRNYEIFKTIIEKHSQLFHDDINILYLYIYKYHSHEDTLIEIIQEKFKNQLNIGFLLNYIFTDESELKRIIKIFGKYTLERLFADNKKETLDIYKSFLKTYHKDLLDEKQESKESKELKLNIEDLLDVGKLSLEYKTPQSVIDEDEDLQMITEISIDYSLEIMLLTVFTFEEFKAVGIKKLYKNNIHINNMNYKQLFDILMINYDRSKTFEQNLAVFYDNMKKYTGFDYSRIKILEKDVLDVMPVIDVARIINEYSR